MSELAVSRWGGEGCGAEQVHGMAWDGAPDQSKRGDRGGPIQKEETMAGNQWWAPRAQWALSAQWKALKRAQTPNGIWPGRKMYTAIYSISPRNLRLGLFRLRKNPLRAPISRIPPKIVAQKLPLGAPLRAACLLCLLCSCIHH